MDQFEQIRQNWIQQHETGYRKFTSALIPGEHHILGIRIPLIRKMAKSMTNAEKKAYLAHKDTLYFEEVLMQGIIVGLLVSEKNQSLLILKNLT